MRIEYTLLHNQDAKFMRPGTGSDHYVQGYSGSLDVQVKDKVNATLERIFNIHNRDDRPDGQERPSLSVGDVILIVGYAFTVENMGFSQIDPPGKISREYPE